MTRLTIGQVAKRSGFSTSALRYYEDHDLLRPVARSRAGYRLYDDTSLARLEFIARAKQLGCSLEEIADLAELWAADDCGPVQSRLHALVTEKLADTRRRGAELVTLTDQLRTAADHLGGQPVDGPCGDRCACLRTTPAATETTPRGEPTLICTLAPDEVSDRTDQWRSLLHRVRGQQALDDGGLRLELDPATPLEDLVRLTVAEQGCCAFFAFAITVDGQGLGLEVRAPDGAADLVGALFGGGSETQ